MRSPTSAPRSKPSPPPSDGTKNNSANSNDRPHTAPPEYAEFEGERQQKLAGQCYDNAMIESFWGRMQTELLNRKRWKTSIELANAIFDYLEIFHNRQRRHSALGMRTPIEFELLHQSTQPVA